MPRSISALMFARNEGAHLRESLPMVRELADEACIVDTGSTDDTVSVAREYGASVSVFIWCDDEAAVYNEGLRLATKEWVFLLNPRDRIAKGDAAKIKARTNGPQDVAYRMTTRTYTNDTSVEGFTPEKDQELARGFAGWYPSVSVRLFPRKNDLAFTAGLDPAAGPPVEKFGIKVRDFDAIVHHYPEQNGAPKPGAAPVSNAQPETTQAWLEQGRGHAARQQWREAAENAGRALERDGDSAQAHQLLAVALEGLGKLEEAAGHARQAFEARPDTPEYMRLFVHQMLRLERRAEARQVILAAIQRGATIADLHNCAGELFYYDNDFEQSIQHFKHAGALGSAAAWNNLGVVYFSRGLLDDAQKAFEKCLAVDPGHRGARRNMEKILNHKNGG